MNSLNFEKIMQGVTIPDFIIKSHKERLKKALLNTFNPQAESAILPVGFFDLNSLFKRLIPTGILAFAVLVIFILVSVLGKNPFSSNATQVQAKEIMDKVTQNVSDKSKIQPELLTSLEEAKLAKDLVVVNQNEAFQPGIQSIKNVLAGIWPQPQTSTETGKLIINEGIVLLGFTNPGGNYVILGIDKKTELPVFRLIKPAATSVTVSPSSSASSSASPAATIKPEEHDDKNENKDNKKEEKQKSEKENRESEESSEHDD